jgi:hypothetical protein
MSTQEAVRTTHEVANRFNELAQTGLYGQIHDELFADNAVSIEPAKGLEMGMTNAEGLDAIRKKGEAFNAMMEEMHGGYSTEPVVAGTHFCVAMGMDVSFKGVGRTKMDEIAVYEVQDGKIVKEQFFY